MGVSERERIVDADKRHLWHPYTPMGRYIDETNPIVVQRAEGARLFDYDGRSYIDANSSWWTALLGHAHPRLVRALKEQADRLCHVALGGITHAPAARLAEELAHVTPTGLDHVFFSDDGSTAVESALKMCAQFWAQNGAPERRHFLALEGAFHGDTMGAAALGGVEEFRRSVAGMLPHWVHLPSPAHDLGAATEALRDELAKNAERIAAVVLEPLVQGAAGMRIYPADYVREARALTSRYGVLLVLDEVFTGFGRTGRMWATDHAAVTPDVICLAKGLSGGMLPFAAVVTNKQIFDGFLGSPDRAFYYGHTFCGNPLGAAVAREVLAVYRDEEVLAGVGERSSRIAGAFDRLRELPPVKATRTLGMIGALDLRGESGYLERGGWRVYNEALKRGAYLRPLGNVVYVAPPLNIPLDDLEELLDIVYASIRAL